MQAARGNGQLPVTPGYEQTGSNPKVRVADDSESNKQFGVETWVSPR